MPGCEQFTNTHLDITINCFWQDRPDEMASPQEISGWLEELFTAFPGHWEIFQAVTTLNVWNPARTDCPEIKNYAGLTYWDGHIDICKPFINRGTVSHEFGHWVALFYKVDPQSPDTTSRMMWALYALLRGADFTAATPGPERWAEDFKDLYGAVGVRGNVDPNDDSNQPGSTVRKPWDVPGLATFIDGFTTVMKRWRQVWGVGDTSYSNGCWMWSRPGWWFTKTWECYVGGQFYTWSWGQWVPGLT